MARDEHLLDGCRMVEPMTPAERDAGNRKIKVGFVLLVTVSPPLITLLGDPTATQIAAAAVGGFLLGLLLVWYLGRLASEFTSSSGRPRR